MKEWTKSRGFQQLVVLLGVVGVSLAVLFVRWSTAPSLILVLYRVTIATVLMTPMAIVHRKEFLFLGRREALLSLLSGVALGLHFITYFEAVRRTSIAAAAVLVDTEVLFVALSSVLFFRKKLGRRAWLAVLLAFIGSAVVALAGSSGGGGSLEGNLFALAGALFMSIYTMLGAVCRRSASTTVYTYLLYASAAVTVMAIALVSGTPLRGYGPVNLLTTLGMAVFCTLLGHSLFSWGLRYLPPAYISTLKLLEPIFSALWGLLFFQERPELLMLAGGGVILLGILLYSRSEST